jgi:hypothetical protein
LFAPSLDVKVVLAGITTDDTGVDGVMEMFTLATADLNDLGR